MPADRTYDRYPLVGWLERRSRRQVSIVAAVVVAYLLLLGLRSMAVVLLDRWWLRTVTDASVWDTVVWARLQLVVGAVVISSILLGGSLLLVRRRGVVVDDDVGDVVRRYRGRMGRAHGWLLLTIVVVLIVRIGTAASSHWQDWLLFRHGGDVGREVPELGGDLGDYLFRLPLLAITSDWIRQLLLVALVLTAFASAVAGELRLPSARRPGRSRPTAVLQLAVLAALLAAAQAVDQVFVRRPRQALDTGGSFVGAGFTEVNVVVPATWVLALVAIATGFVLVVAGRRRSLRLAVVAVAVAAVAQLLGALVVPAVVERFVVTPAAGARQLPYVEHNRVATREAFGLETVATTTRPLGDGVTEVGADDRLTVDRVPLWDVALLPAALQVLQGRPATRITDVDLDRYELEGERRPVMVAPRSASRDDLPERGWVQEHLVYTHGDGIVAVPADGADADGRPDVEALADELVPERPQLYFGEGLGDWYVIVGSDRREQGGTPFSGDTGIELSSMWRRAVLGLASGDIEPLLSSELTPESQLLYRREVNERLTAIAPWATFGSDPYPVITADRVTWVVDGYTTSASYPYAQHADFQGSPVNYVHASLKATVDAYDGTVHLYRTEIAGADDPVLDAWVDIFPGLVEPIDALPAELAEHLRYPPELLSAQSALIGRYHVDDAETLFSGTARWSPSAAAPSAIAAGSPGPSTPVTAFLAAAGAWSSTVPMSPGAGAASSSARDRLVAVLIADNDAPEGIELVTVDSGAGRDVATPLVAQSAIDADPELAQQLTLLDASGSVVQFGPMTPLLLDGGTGGGSAGVSGGGTSGGAGGGAGGGEDGAVSDDGVVWMRSIIVSGTAERTTPRLYGVVAVSFGLVGFGPDAAAAIDDAIAQRQG